MHLSDYMTLRGLSDDEMAGQIGRSRATVSRMRRRVARPDWDTIDALRRATKGQVTANDFMETQAEAS